MVRLQTEVLCTRELAVVDGRTVVVRFMRPEKVGRDVRGLVQVEGAISATLSGWGIDEMNALTNMMERVRQLLETSGLEMTIFGGPWRPLFPVTEYGGFLGDEALLRMRAATKREYDKIIEERGLGPPGIKSPKKAKKAARPSPKKRASGSPRGATKTTKKRKGAG